MPNLMSIGRFSRRTGLTIKALRLYDERGILRPAVVDLASGFRYYSPEQVARAERIRTLRALEMPLEAIRAVLEADDPEVRRGRLADHERWIAGRIAGYRRALRVLRTVDGQRTGREGTMETETRGKPYACSFCGKENGEVERLIAGPNGVFICDECVERCNEIIARERAAV